MYIQYEGWAQRAIETAVANGWIKDSAEFDPNTVIGRGALVQLVILEQYRNCSEVKFIWTLHIPQKENAAFVTVSI